MTSKGYTDGYGWIDEPKPVIVQSLNELDWLREVVAAPAPDLLQQHPTHESRTMSENTERDELLAVIMEADKTADAPTVFTIWEHLTDAVLAAGYRKVEMATEFGIVFNRHAVFLTPPAETLHDFKERYESECGWMITDRDTYLTRTYSRCSPQPGVPAIHDAEASL